MSAAVSGDEPGFDRAQSEVHFAAAHRLRGLETADTPEAHLLIAIYYELRHGSDVQADLAEAVGLLRSRLGEA